MVDPSDSARTPGGREKAEDEWILLAEAAAIVGCAESWLIDRCCDGRLPSRPAPGSGLVVPLATVRALVDGRISD